MKRVVIVVPAGEVNLSSVGGPFEILQWANNYWQKQGHPARISIEMAGFVSEAHGHNNFMTVHPADIRTIKKADLVIIPSMHGVYADAVHKNPELIEWIREQHLEGAELASVCSGAFILAATGLMNGRTCSTHWNALAEFQQMFPEVHTAPERIITDENGIYTNGGAYSFLNLILYLVEKIFDRTTAIYCAKVFQIDMERATQSAFSMFQVQKSHGDALINQAQDYIEEHLEDRISFEKLAGELAISRRNFDRRFIKATGNTPVEYLQRIKVEAAKKELERGRKSVLEVMNDVGYADHKAFREVFKRITGLSPMDYRAKYQVRM